MQNNEGETHGDRVGDRVLYILSREKKNGEEYIDIKSSSIDIKVRL